MISLGFKSDIDKLTESFDKMTKKQVPYATALALNRVAQLARDVLKVNMNVYFDRPTPYTLNSLFIKNATRTNLVAIVGHKSSTSKLSASTYLAPEIEGGSRSFKSTEKKVSEYLVPAKATKLDAYGNIPARLLGAIRQLLSSNQAAMDFGGRTLVVVKAGNTRGLAPGVYERVSDKTKITGRKGSKTATVTGGALRPIVFFESHVHYRSRYDMKAIVERVMMAEFGRQFNAAMDYALSTAKITISD